LSALRIDKQSAAARDLGLDAVRAMSIALVLLSHSIFFYPHSFVTTLVVQYLGWLGVEVFFSLSGFLIGRIMLSMEGGRLDGRALLTFFLRRWLRTLPLYYLVLLAIYAAGFPITRIDFLLLHGFVPPGRWGLQRRGRLGWRSSFIWWRRC
jgi:peptidoglycan/LPS O-acetylase OafA/YrhL